MNEGNIKHLYIIGNGFDLFTGLETSYSNFRKWLERNYAFIYEALTSAYDANGEWWNDFECQLGNLDIAKYADRYLPKKMTKKEVMEAIRFRKEHEDEGDGLPNTYMDSPCAHRLERLLDILQYCFEKWVQDARFTCSKYHFTHLEKEDSIFINFNYTDTLEIHYGIPEDRVIHIHGRASKHEHLVFGHNNWRFSDDFHNNDEQKVREVLNRYEKNPYYYIAHYNFWEAEWLRSIEHIHVLGFSFSGVDIDYLDWIANHTGRKCDWEVSWHREEDKNRINDFISETPQLRGRLRLIQIEEVPSSA